MLKTLALLVCVFATIILGVSAEDSRCKFFTGDAKGGGEIWVGYLSRQQCIDTCIKRKKEVDDSVNGATVYAGKAGCWCASGMTYRSDSKSYASCFLEIPDPNSNIQCALYYGDGEGGDNIYIGKLTRSECVDACIKRKNEGDDSINGATVYANEADKGCYCEKHMTYRDNGKTWKSCFLRVPDVNADERCALFTGDGKGGGEIYLGKLTRSECIDACIKRKNEEDDLINGITVYADADDKGCYCEKGMKWRNDNKGWKSCFLRVPDPNANKQCELNYGDGEGGANTWIGYLTKSECIESCIARKRLIDDSINGVLVYANDATKGCYCEKGMTYRDGKTKWKSCILREPATVLASGLCEVNVELRKECGPAGITKAQCESRGCCFNSNFVKSIWCFYKAKANNQCSVNPESRKECGPAGITKEQCEAKPGCCFNDKTPGTKWCYHERIIKATPNKFIFLGNKKCADKDTYTFDVNVGCDGWNGITLAECQRKCESSERASQCPSDKKCKYVMYYEDTKWCHHAGDTCEMIDTNTSALYEREGIKGDNRCTFSSGDAVGGTEIDLGMKTGRECIDACLAKKKTDDSINGVSIYANNKPGCWCEQNMNAIVDHFYYKSCFLIDPASANPCDQGNGGCQQVCTNVNGVAECSCNDGYNVAGSKCVDINECTAGTSGCSQQCVNSDGSYECACFSGYKMGKDGKTCEVALRCNGRDNGCCTPKTPCQYGDGDCDNDNECVSGLVCGHDNCPWGDKDDCCTLRSFKDVVKDIQAVESSKA